MPGPYPQQPASVSGNTITVSAFLNNPPRVQRAIESLTVRRFVADLIFSPGPAAAGGSVIYDQLTADVLFTERDVQEIEPGSEFPILNTGETSPLVAIDRKYGGEVMLTDEAVRRDNRGLLNREMTRLRNTIVRKVDTVAMTALRSAPVLTFAASGDWSTAATDIISDLATGINMITAQDLGYEAPNTALINPAQELDLLRDSDIRTALPRERTDGLIASGNLGRLMGLDFIVTNRVNAGEVFLLTRGMAGSISDEVPLYAKPIADERRETTFVHGARVLVPYVTDPKAVVRITGA